MRDIACLELPFNVLWQDIKNMVITLLLFFLNYWASDEGVVQFSCSYCLSPIVRVVTISLELQWEVLSVF